MGSSEETKVSKPEKSPPPPADQANNVHVYPDWAAMQAYYGPRMAIPPYFNSAVATGHTPHPYMWGPQPMMAPYGATYAAIYGHGGVYAHPGVSIAATPNVETPTKSSGSTDQGPRKKMKGFDGLAMSIGNGNCQSDEGRANSAQSPSEETEGSSDGSNVNTSGTGRNGRKRSREEIPITDGDAKTENGRVEVKGAPEKVNATLSGAMNVVPPVTALELRNTSISKESPTTPSQACAIIPSEAWLQNERELKKERRKQSNRESARRSRLRKQAEAEELAKRVDSLTAENMTLKSEINRLAENSVKLKLENTMLTEKMKKMRGGPEGLVKKEEKKRVPISTENLLARVNNSGSIDRNDEGEEMYEKNSNPGGAKLRQLLDTSPRTNALAAS